MREERAYTVAYKGTRRQPNRHCRISRQLVAINAKDANRKGSRRARQPQKIQDGEAKEATSMAQDSSQSKPDTRPLHGASRQIIPGGCAAAKPAPQTRKSKTPRVMDSGAARHQDDK